MLKPFVANWDLMPKVRAHIIMYMYNSLLSGAFLCQELSTTTTATSQLSVDLYMLVICSVQGPNQVSLTALILQCHHVGTILIVEYDVQVYIDRAFAAILYIILTIKLFLPNTRKLL